MKFLFTHLPPPRALQAYRLLCGIEFPYPALKRGWLHGRQMKAAWNLEQIAAEIGERCWLSHYEDGDGDDRSLRLSAVAGFWPRGGFLEILPQNRTTLEDHPRPLLALYAASPAECARIFAELLAHYVHPEQVTAGAPRIGILNSAFDSLEVQRIAITADQTVPREELALFYGAGMPGWVDRWLALLEARRYGLSILTGPPGTGKTTLLRSLAQWLNSSHMFYFMPAARFVTVESGEIVKFWADQNRQSKLRKVLILEDAESVLQRRGSDNREKVASLLNLTDGMMGDALGLHVICTLNCGLADLDPALLRPGRLIGQRELGPLATDEARMLARHLRRPAPDGPATLAEILHGPAPVAMAPARRPLGFHATVVTT